MTGRKAAIGLTVLSVLLFCAFAAPSASAAEKESANTTAFTCVAEPLKKGGFSDEHCDEVNAKNEGAFAHCEALALKTETKIGATNEGVTESTKKIEPAVLRAKIGLTATETTCEKYTVDETKSFIENSEPTAKDHKVKGTVRAELKTCKVLKPAKCTTREPIVVEATFVGVDGLKDPVSGKENAMGLRFKGEGVSGESKDVFATLRYEGAECSLKEKEYPVTGSAIVTAGPTTESGQENKHTGGTLVFSPKSSMQKLHLGNEANPAEFETISTPKMAEKGNPTPLTTTT